MTRASIVMASVTFGVLSAPPPAVADEAEYDGVQQLIDFEARAALAEGDYLRAWHLFWRLLLIDPNDASALRECGRVAHALGDFSYAARALERAAELRPEDPDPELHYLLGESLFALGRTADAEAQFDSVLRQLGPTPEGERHRQWLARIYALRGDATRATALYETLLPDDKASDEYANIVLSIVEAKILAGDWRGAEQRVREFLESHPDHVRGRSILAWILERDGALDEELRVRRDLADEGNDGGQSATDYARALERAYDYPAALDQYREARVRGAADVTDEIARLEHRMSTEIASGVTMREDPAGSAVGAIVAVSTPVGRRTRAVATARLESTSSGQAGESVSDALVEAWGAHVGSSGGVVGVGGSARVDDDGGGDLGVAGLVRTSPARGVSLHASGRFNAPWRESVSTIRELGTEDVLAAQLYSRLVGGRLVLHVGGQVRRLGLPAEGDTPERHATQWFGSAGIDVIPWASFDRTARGQLLDHTMLSPAAVSDALVLSYRHYELESDAPFGPRLVLVEHSRIDELSVIARRVFDRDGTVAVELRGGLGYDWWREVDLWRGGGSLLLSPFDENSRITVEYDVASDSRTGLAGTRHSGWLVLHVDL